MDSLVQGIFSNFNSGDNETSQCGSIDDLSMNEEHRKSKGKQKKGYKTPIVGIRIYPATNLAQHAVVDGFMEENNNLLFPKFYLVRELADW